MNGGAFEVIGVLEVKGQSGFGQDQDDIVLAPLTTVKRRISGRQRGAPTRSARFRSRPKARMRSRRVQEDVENLLRQRHRTREGEDDFTVQNLSSITETAAQTTQVFTYLLGGISAVSLLVGGIGIMNIMLVVGHGTDARDRPAQSAGRAPVRHSSSIRTWRPSRFPWPGAWSGW